MFSFSPLCAKLQWVALVILYNGKRRRRRNLLASLLCPFLPPFLLQWADVGRSSPTHYFFTRLPSASHISYFFIPFLSFLLSLSPRRWSSTRAATTSGTRRCSGCCSHTRSYAGEGIFLKKGFKFRMWECVIAKSWKNLNFWLESQTLDGIFLKCPQRLFWRFPPFLKVHNFTGNYLCTRGGTFYPIFFFFPSGKGVRKERREKGNHLHKIMVNLPKSFNRHPFPTFSPSLSLK